MRSFLRQFAISVVIFGSVCGCPLMPPPDPSEIVGGNSLPAKQRGITLDHVAYYQLAEV